jgi:D-alanyl-D-alanine carboxypeptidase (penicillin-binding protein 5/6)
VPIAGLTKVMTAYVVLLDHPLAVGDDGPPIRVTPQVMAASQQQQAAQQSVVPMAVGETLSELQALQGVLVAQGNNVATLLTAWDAPTTAAFVAKMNHTARALGLRSTTFTDANGVAPGSVSTPADLIRLGEAAMAMPVFRQIVGMPQVTLPLAGTVYNFDYDLGHDGFVGIKTGSDTAAGGCFLFEAQHTVGGTTVSVMGAVLGESGTSPLTSALYDADVLVRAAFASLAPIPVVPAGEHIGHMVAAWGPSVPVTAAPSTVVAWPGLVAQVRERTTPVSSAIASGSTVGVLTVQFGDQRVAVPLQTTEGLPGPSTVWRLTRL